MPETPITRQLLRRVQRRLQIRSFAKASYYALLTLLACWLAAIVLVRLLGLLPDADDGSLWLIAIIPLAALAAIVFQRRVRRATAASAIDNHVDARDLFLTVSSLQTSAGQYQPLVAQAAEAKAEQIEPVEVVPFEPWRLTGRLLAAVGGAVLLVWLTPRLDPFGHVAAAEQEQQKQDELVEVRRSNEQQREQLKKKSRQIDALEEALDGRVSQLKQDFRAMRPRELQPNAKILTKHRSGLGEQWKQQSTDPLRRMLSRPLSRQQIGGSRNQKMNRWLKELQQGSSESLQKELQKAQATMQALMEAKDPEQRRKLAAQLKRDLQDLKKFAADRAESKELAQALSKALKAMEAGKPPEQGDNAQPMSPEAAEALRESLELSNIELQQLARSAKDLKRLEQALETIRQAQQLNQQGQLDGEKLEGCETLGDYGEMYAQMMGNGALGGGVKERNEGGDGDGGAGGETPEDDSDPEGYKDEKTRGRIKAGKVLLSIKTKEYAEEADFDPAAVRQYQDSVQSLKDGVQSAIENEEIPPGYVEGIKKYFDRIEDVDPQLSE